MSQGESLELGFRVTRVGQTALSECRQNILIRASWESERVRRDEPDFRWRTQEQVHATSIAMTSLILQRLRDLATDRTGVRRSHTLCSNYASTLCIFHCYPYKQQMR